MDPRRPGRRGAPAGARRADALPRVPADRRRAPRRDRAAHPRRRRRDHVARVRRARRADRRRAGRARRRARRHGRDDAAQPARVPPRRHGGAAPRRGAVLGLQHLHRPSRSPTSSATPATASSSPSAHFLRDRAGRPPRTSRRSRTSCSIDGADDDIMSLAELEGTGSSALPLRRDLARGRAATTSPTIIYTSGTTGPPKGVELTHANAMAECAAWSERYPVDARRARDVLPADRPRRRPLDEPLVGVAHARLHDHARSPTCAR